MPTSTICYHDDPIFRMSFCNFIQKYLHTDCVYMGQDQRVHLAVRDRNSRICVGIFLSHHRLAHWTMRLGTPTAPDIRDAAKASFILKHQPYWAFSRPPCVNL